MCRRKNVCTCVWAEPFGPAWKVAEADNSGTFYANFRCSPGHWPSASARPARRLSRCCPSKSVPATTQSAPARRPPSPPSPQAVRAGLASAGPGHRLSRMGRLIRRRRRRLPPPVSESAMVVTFAGQSAAEPGCHGRRPNRLAAHGPAGRL